MSNESRLNHLIRTHLFKYNPNSKDKQTIDGLLDCFGTNIDMLHFEPASKIEHAWAVVEKMRENQYTPKITWVISLGGHWYCEFHLMSDELYFSVGETVTEAICKAALKALGVEYE